MNTMISALRRFDEIAAKNFDDSTRIGIARDGSLTGTADAGRLSRAKTVTVRGQTQVAENNAVRTALLDALKTQFGAKIPESVKKALKGSSLVGGSDMNTDKSGAVVSGRPLTMRRIKAVMTAVKTELDRMNTVSPKSVRQQLDNLEASGKTNPKEDSPVQWVSHPHTETYFARIVNEAVKNAIQTGESGESIVNSLTDKIVSDYQSQPARNVRYYFPQLASGKGSTIDREALKTAVSNFLQSLGVDVNRPKSIQRPWAYAQPLFPEMLEVNAEPQASEAKFLVPTKQAVKSVVAKLVDASKLRVKNESVVERFTHTMHQHIKDVIESGAATRDELTEKFSGWLMRYYNPTVNTAPAYIFPALTEPGTESRINLKPLHDEVRAFLDEIGIQAK